MEKFTRSLVTVLLSLSVTLFAACDDSDPPVDEGDPENPTLFECSLTVIDDETDQPRANQSVTLKRTNKDGTTVHSTQEYNTDQNGVVEMEVRSGYYTAEVAFEPGKEKDNAYEFEIAYHKRTFSMRVKDMNPDIEPHPVTVTVKDAKTGSVWAGKSFDLYSVTGTGETEKLGTYSTGHDGKASTELVAGRYRVACAYFDGVSPLTNTLDFQVKRDLPNTAEISVEPIHFADDFSWITPDWGPTVELRVWYASLDPPTANSAAEYEVRWDLVTDPDNVRTRDATGWTVPETLAGDARFIFFRPGMLKFGSASRGGAITTPALSNIKGKADIKLTFDSNPMHTVSNGAWVIADNGNSLTMIVRASGGGYFRDADGNAVPELKLDNPSGLTGGWPVDRWNELEAVVYDATPDTKITLESAVLNGGSGQGCRSFVDNVVVAEIY